MKTESLSPAAVSQLFKFCVTHLRKTGWAVRVTVREDFLPVNGGRRFKRIPVDAAAEYADILGRIGSVTIAISIGKTDAAERRERPLAEAAGYRHFNAFDMRSLREFLNSIK